MNEVGCSAGFLSKWLNDRIGQCCVQHDYNYAIDTTLTRLQADWELLKCALGEGEAVIGGLTFIAVSLFGWLFYKKRKLK